MAFTVFAFEDAELLIALKKKEDNFSSSKGFSSSHPLGQKIGCFKKVLGHNLHGDSSQGDAAVAFRLYFSERASRRFVNCS